MSKDRLTRAAAPHVVHRRLLVWELYRNLRRLVAVAGHDLVG